jgi:alkanesulfonate monooxygenase SsuD/methylene tetrahydromethanopterin reductase-like flavin-dependent oxidoreductase (luciferase family)
MAIRRPPGASRTLPEVYATFLADCVLAESLGFSGVWAGEAHFSPDAWTPSVIAVLSAVAARTTRVRLIPAVLALPLYDPLRVAEDIAVLDNLSGGRAELGVGVGSDPRAFAHFGVAWEERHSRMREATEVLERLLSGERVTHRGRHFAYEDVTMTTLPAQERLPIWVGAHGPRNVAWAAERGYDLLSGTPLYAEALRAAGRDPAEHRAAPLVTMHLAETDDEAWAAAAEPIHWTCAFYRSRGEPLGASATGPLPELPAAHELRHVEGFRIYPGGAYGTIVGTPEHARALLEVVRAGAHGPITHLPIEFRLPGMSDAAVRRSMELFATEVLPALV